MTFENIFNDTLKNALARSNHEHCKWHFRVSRHPGWEPLLYTLPMKFKRYEV